MIELRKSGLWDRAIRNLRYAWKRMGSIDAYFSEQSFSPELSETDRERLISQMQACLEARGGEVSARSRAAALGHAYHTLNEEGRKRFLSVLAEEFGPDRDRIDLAVADVSKALDPATRASVEAELRQALEAPRLKLLTQFNALPEGVKFLVDLRAELIPWARQDDALAGVEGDLKALLTAWFDVGFLELRQITWDAPASLLEKLFAYEAVHEIKGWDDLKNRLAVDRRCFAFFHPRMPEEPLIFVWVALSEGMAGNIQDLLDEDAPIQNVESADTAIFYSISNAQIGLSGINFGNFLIKRVVDSLRTELRGIRTFATLSPIPGFMPWLRRRLREKDFNFLTREQEENLVSLSSKSVNQTANEALEYFLFRTEWHDREDIQSALHPILLKLAAHYLVNEKRSGGTAVDSVAHFHLNNGSRIEQLHWNADTSARGLEQSAGIMLNYRYLLDDIDANHESYRSGGEIVTSSSVRALLKD